MAQVTAKKHTFNPCMLSSITSITNPTGAIHGWRGRAIEYDDDPAATDSPELACWTRAAGGFHHLRTQSCAVIAASGATVVTVWQLGSTTRIARMVPARDGSMSRSRFKAGRGALALKTTAMSVSEGCATGIQ